MAPCPNPSHVAASCFDGTVAVWDVKTARRLQSVGQSAQAKFTNIPGRLLGFKTGSLSNLPVAIARDLRDCHYPRTIAVLPQEEVIVCGWNDGLSIWDPSTNEHRFALDFREEVCVVAPSSDGKQCVAGTRAGYLFLWDIHIWRQEIRLLSRRKSQQGTFTDGVWPQDCRHLATTGAWTALEIWDPQSEEEPTIVVRFPDGVRYSNTAHDAKVAQTSRPGVVAVARMYAVAQFRVPGGELLSLWQHPSSLITDLCALPNDRNRSLMVIALGSDNRFLVLDLQTGIVLAEQQADAVVHEVAASRDGRHVITRCSKKRGATVWKVNWLSP
jgi:WD40 repeat protein